MDNASPGREDTIAAIATPPGMGGISIIRLSGPDAVSIGDKIVRLRNGRSLVERPSWSASLGDVVDERSGEAVDEAVVLVMKGPHSYTGEDVVEIQCHGGRLVSEKVLSLAFLCGARAAEPGEFTRRAYLSGRISLDAAEAVLDVVNARSEASLVSAERRLKGKLGGKIRGWEKRLFEILAEMEGAADFPEDVESGLAAAVEDLEAVLGEIRALLDSAPLGLALTTGIEVCLVGGPNAGKSSLFNALLGEDRAIVTSIPGTTRDVIREATEWCGLPVVLVDTAGLRETEEVVEALGVERARSAASQAEVILYVVDDSRGLTAEDEKWIKEWASRKALIVVNKMDLGKGLVSESALRKVGEKDASSGAPGPTVSVVRASAVTGEGLEEIKRRVAAWFLRDGQEPGAIPGSARQVDCLKRAERAIDAAIAEARTGWTEDVVVLSVEEAARALGEITGKDVSAETLDEIFSKFCVGK